MTARKAKLPSSAEFMNAYNVVKSLAEDELDPRRAKLFMLAADQLGSAAIHRATGGTRQAVIKRHRWAITNVQKALFLRGGGA